MFKQDLFLHFYKQVMKTSLNVYREYKGPRLPVCLRFKVLIRLVKFWKTKV